MNNSDNQQKQESQQTQTIDYFQELNAVRGQFVVNISSLERTIFQLLRNYPEVFLYNQQLFFDFEKKRINVILENGLLLGSGAYGNVYSTINPNNNQPAALKVQGNCDFDYVLQQAEEFRLQKKIAEKYPECIIQIQNQIHISQKYMNTYRMYAYLDLGLGNLKEYLKQLKKFNDLQFNNLFDCILDSIIKIHSLQIAHGDIKLENIINTIQKGWVLADFGCAIQYSTPFGEYPIVGTKIYMQKKQRQALQNNLKRVKMNLFKKDIYAFQLVMLQILFPEDSIINLQYILDEQLKVHPKIDSLYNKDYIFIKQKFNQIKFIRSPQIQEILLTKEDIKMNQEDQFYLNQIHKIFQNILDLPQNPQTIIWGQEILNITHFKFTNQDEKIKQIMIIDQFISKYFENSTADEIFEEISFENLTKLEYDLYLDILEKKGSKMLQLMLCQGYQAVQGEFNCNLKLQEAELLYIIGEMDQAKNTINSIQNELELENDESILKFFCLKSRLNNTWIQTRDEIISYLINYKSFYQILLEWKFILIDSIWLSKSNGMQNYIYHKDQYKIFNFIDQIGSKNISNMHVIQELINSKERQQPQAFNMEQEIYNSNQINKEQFNNIMEVLQNSRFDKYMIFYQGWIYFEAIKFNNIDQLFIEEFIKYIDENLQNYYFNWVIYDFYAQFLTYQRKYYLAKIYFNKAYQIILNDCIYNQFLLLSHLFLMQVQEDNFECIDSFTQMINLLNQMPKTTITQYLFITQFCLIEYTSQILPLLNLRDFLDQAKSVITSSLKRINQTFNYFYQKSYAIKKNDFCAFQQLMWNELPKIQEESGKENEYIILESFNSLILMLDNKNIGQEIETRYTSRMIQLFIILNSLGYDEEHFPFSIVDATFYFYARTCFKKGEGIEFEKSKQFFEFFIANKYWFFY
ncbi:unnamed protein product [Paramecium sonneborni]|uniref:Protein kinase domain-containing protein n=1 Tax=Paramecium sonneborni TaxID=65129 RepID=A0A8S1R442_9CILI|nr:unnamed protein product [Paramecium sonneborni]